MKEKVAVVFGTFAPLHQGHIDLIQRAKRQCDRVCVIVSGYKGDRGEEVGLPLQKRFRYIREGFSNDEVKEKGWRRSDRADNAHKNKIKSEGIELAKQIVIFDSKKQNILTLLDIGEIIHDYLSYLYPNEKISDANQIRREWLKGIKAGKKGRPKGNIDKRNYKLQIYETLKELKK